MKKIIILQVFLLSLISCNQKPMKGQSDADRTGIQFTDTSDMTNNFYDNAETYPLPVKEITVEGEIANPGKVDFSKLPKHSVIVKETLLDSSGSDKFVGAYRYDGYSLFDILNDRILKKTNSSEFSPIIDLYIEIENEKGEKVVFSWGEIYYPNNLHKIILATDMSRIVPSKTKELWVLPLESRIVAGNDLITERNIFSPVKIRVKSYPKSFSVIKGLFPMYSGQFKVIRSNSLVTEISVIPNNINIETFNTIFYGRGKGIHSTQPFIGIMLKDLLQKYYPVNKNDLQSGIMCIVGLDGYRCTASYSEIFNRNDQQEFLLVRTKENEDGGLFRIFAASDFFSDRAIKSVSEIHLGY
jgi:hypothetical protein